MRCSINSVECLNKYQKLHSAALTPKNCNFTSQLDQRQHLSTEKIREKCDPAKITLCVTSFAEQLSATYIIKRTEFLRLAP